VENFDWKISRISLQGDTELDERRLLKQILKK
jgi:hypothetical protein